jgi:hypothetical protein
VANQPIAVDATSECVCYFHMGQRGGRDVSGGVQGGGGIARTKRDKS